MSDKQPKEKTLTFRTRNWTCKKHKTFGDNPMLGCAYCGYSGRGMVGTTTYKTTAESSL